MSKDLMSLNLNNNIKDQKTSSLRSSTFNSKIKLLLAASPYTLPALFFAFGLVLGALAISFSRPVAPSPIYINDDSIKKEAEVFELAPVDNPTCDPQNTCCRDFMYTGESPECTDFLVKIEGSDDAPANSLLVNSYPVNVIFSGSASDADNSDAFNDIRSFTVDFGDGSPDVFYREFSPTLFFPGIIENTGSPVIHIYNKNSTATLTFTDYDGNRSGACEVTIRSTAAETHLECVSGSCQEIEGAGGNLCDLTDDTACLYLACASDDYCEEVGITGDPANYPNIDGCLDAGQYCGSQGNAGFCTNASLDFVGEYPTHYVGDRVNITGYGYSEHEDGITKFKYRFGRAANSPVVTCGQDQTPNSICAAISSPNSEGIQSAVLTYTLQESDIGNFEVFVTVCDANGCGSYFEL